MKKHINFLAQNKQLQVNEKSNLPGQQQSPQPYIPLLSIV